MSIVAPDSRFPEHLAEMARRADAALGRGGYDALALAAGSPPLHYRDDQHYPHRAVAHFLAWAPLPDAPASLVVYRPGRRPTLLFYQPDDYWHAPPSIPEERWLDSYEVVRLKQPAEARQHLPPRTAYVGPAADWLGSTSGVAINPESVVAALDYGRAAKTEYELECLAIASRRAVPAHRAALAAWTDGACEYEIHLAYVAATGQEEWELPYTNIIAANEASAVLHYTVRRREAPSPRRSFLIDAGAQYRGYAADITRSHAAADGVFAELISALAGMESRLCDLVTVGRHYPDIHQAAHVGIGEILARLGIVRCTAAAAVESGLTKVFFPHGIGHLLGLQVHDVGGWFADASGLLTPRPAAHPFLRLGRTLAEGTVVTIEPGIYFIPLLLEAARADGRGRDINWQRVEELAPYGGVRIEDNVVATANGPRNLTREAGLAP